MESKPDNNMIFSGFGVDAIPMSWWSINQNYFIYGIVAVTLTVCFFVLRRKG